MADDFDPDALHDLDAYIRVLCRRGSPEETRIFKQFFLAKKAMTERGETPPTLDQVKVVPPPGADSANVELSPPFGFITVPPPGTLSSKPAESPSIAQEPQRPKAESPASPPAVVQPSLLVRLAVFGLKGLFMRPTPSASQQPKPLPPKEPPAWKPPGSSGESFLDRLRSKSKKED